MIIEYEILNNHDATLPVNLKYPRNTNDVNKVNEKLTSAGIGLLS